MARPRCGTGCSGRSSPCVALLVVNVVARARASSTSRSTTGTSTAASIDILRNSAPLLLVALGMTLVIATRGIDLSVGAVDGHLRRGGAARIIAGRADPTRSAARASSAMRRSPSRSALVLGLWNGFLVAVLGIQPIIATLVLMIAGRGVAQLITDGQIITMANAAVRRPRRRLPARPAVRR